MVREAPALVLSDLLPAALRGAEPTFEPCACHHATKACSLCGWHQRLLFGLCLEASKHSAL